MYYSIIVDVPWVLVDGVLLENTALLQKTVCSAYTGIPPASCKNHALASAKEVVKCDNN